MTAPAAPSTRRARRPQGSAPSKRRPARSTRRRSRTRLLVAGIVAGLGFAALGALALWARSPVSGQGRRLEFAVAAGEAPGALAERLATERAVERPWLFGTYLRLFGGAPAPGLHTLRDDLSPRELAQRLARSPGRPRVRVLVPEGWNHVQIGRRLEAFEVTSLKEFRRIAFDPSLRAELGITGPSVEGYLFPATYELFVDSDAAQVVRTLVAEAKKRLGRLEAENPSAFERLAREHGFGVHEILTLASIIERETGDADELPLVAGVFMNRLTDPSFRPRRTLQSDPTALYGCLVEPTRAVSCAVSNDVVTPGMLRDGANRYNTYRHAGLPPGPISNPGERALRAVLSPEKTDYLYFVAKGQGKHSFSRTFDEHREAIDKGRALSPDPRRE